MRRTQKEVKRVIGVWQERMRLRDWEISVDFSEPADEGANASIWIATDYLRATIHLGEGWERAPDPLFQRTMAHELLHLVTHGMHAAAQSVMYKGLLTRAVEEQFDSRFEHEWERAVDHMAVAWYDACGPA